ITIISMMIYHAMWDLWSFNLGVTSEMLFGRKGYIWEQTICYTFIFLSGFCFSLGRHHLKRGLMALGGGIVITVVTLLVIPEARDIFGVLWLIGSSILLMIPLDRLFSRHKDRKGWCGVFLVVALLLFVITRNVNYGYLGFEGFNLVRLPDALYKGYFMTYLGFSDPTFYSSDYFSLIPWFFLFLSGYFTEKLLKGTGTEEKILTRGFKPLEILGRHSFIIYMLHQVVIYGLIYGYWYICARTI
ncbi:MAG: DUF1624 domain-containing protein, partial [Parasporobacterium sp.]|nr:DUF1624 domain-containing protein [Parasporobacterium sp.]